MPLEFPNLTVVNHPLIQHKLTWLRSESTGTDSFRQLLREVSQLLAYEATRALPTALVTIKTPMTTAQLPVISGKKLCLVSILRAGNGMLEGFLDLIPLARVGHIGIERNPDTLEASMYYFKVPNDLASRQVLMVDPMLATGHSCAAAVARLKEAGCTHITLVCLLAAPDGVRHMHEVHPDVPVFAAALDSHLNEQGYIVPGLGDAGDRLYGTR